MDPSSTHMDFPATFIVAATTTTLRFGMGARAGPSTRRFDQAMVLATWVEVFGSGTRCSSNGIAMIMAVGPVG